MTFYAWNLLDLFIAFLRLFFSLQNSKLSKYMRVIVQYIESCAQMQFRFFYNFYVKASHILRPHQNRNSKGMTSKQFHFQWTWHGKNEIFFCFNEISESNNFVSTVSLWKSTRREKESGGSGRRNKKHR